MPRKFPKSLLEVDFLPNVRVGIVVEGPLTLIGTLVAEIEENDRHHGDPVICPPIPPCPPVDVDVKVDVDVDLEPEFLLVQLTTAFTLTVDGVTITFPIGTIVAVNIEEILLIGPQ
ncbi:MAG: hypothetical protein P4N41_26060 [Negativicutes bacterium]|nr:hypothetical protein [Negativicutes bacterium]